MVNKYDQLQVQTLIRGIQETCMKLQDKNQKKKMSSHLTLKHSKEIREMRSSVIARLQKMDRSQPEFFEVGYYVTYQHPLSEKGPRDAVVMGRDAPYVIIRLLEEEDGIKVEPNYLTIKYLRNL